MWCQGQSGKKASVSSKWGGGGGGDRGAITIRFPYPVLPPPFASLCLPSSILYFVAPVFKLTKRIWDLFLESPEKPFVKLPPAYSVKLVFSYVVKGIKIKITAKFRASRRFRFEDTK